MHRNSSAIIFNQPLLFELDFFYTDPQQCLSIAHTLIEFGANPHKQIHGKYWYEKIPEKWRSAARAMVDQTWSRQRHVLLGIIFNRTVAAFLLGLTRHEITAPNNALDSNIVDQEILPLLKFGDFIYEGG